MRVADNAALYKSVLKAIGLRHELMVSFMARRHPAEQGCGAHINVSLRDASSGEGVFFDEAEPDCISRTMRHFIGGLHAHVPELFLLFAPHLNSYKRFFPELFTPLNNTWGVNNKTVAFRAINLSRNSARIEVRVSGADLSPHLALAAVVAAGRRGIEEAIEPPPPVVGDGWSVSDAPGPGFPLRFPDAIDRFEASALARELMGDDFVDQFASDRRWQLDEFERAVTDWELKMYAEGV